MLRTLKIHKNLDKIVINYLAVMMNLKIVIMKAMKTRVMKVEKMKVMRVNQTLKNQKKIFTFKKKKATLYLLNQLKNGQKLLTNRKLSNFLVQLKFFL